MTDAPFGSLTKIFILVCLIVLLGMILLTPWFVVIAAWRNRNNPYYDENGVALIMCILGCILEICLLGDFIIERITQS